MPKEEPFGFEPEGERPIIVGKSPEEPCPVCGFAIAWRLAADTHWRCQHCDPATVDQDVAACRVVGQ